MPPVSVVIVGALVVIQPDAAGGWGARTGAPETVQPIAQTGALPAPPPLVYDGDDAVPPAAADGAGALATHDPDADLRRYLRHQPPDELADLVAACLRGVWRATNGR